MKNFIQTLKNIWSIDELKTRIMTTLGLILIFRIGSYVILPGVNPDALNGEQSAVAGLLDIFAGGALSRASIFALGIMPYITASIIMQLLGIAVPTIQKLQREGESGRRKINQYTRLLTIIICALQAPGIIALTIPDAAHPPMWSGSFPFITFYGLSVITILVAGSMFIMWLGEKITDKGIGNGISILIMIGIVANLPAAFVQELVTRHNNGAVVIILIEMAMLLFVILFSILLVQGTRRVPIQFAKRIVSGRGGRQQLSQGARQFLPIKVNAAGVMPIIFAQALMVLPTYIGQALQWDSLAGFADPRSFMYNAFLAVMIILFTYFYTAITINPNQMADELKRNGGFIPGVKPGKNTADFIDSLLSRITLPGSIFLALIAILPAFAMMFGIQQSFALFYGGTSLLIMVGVVLDTLQQIESYLLNRQYDGLMKSGRIKGRSSMPGVSV